MVVRGGKRISTVNTHNTNGDICDSNQMFISNHVCRQRMDLNLQILRVCREIYSEAALLPFGTNAFILSGGLWSDFRAAFTQRFTQLQRRAIRTAVLPAIFMTQVHEVPRLVPNVKGLWLESPAPWRQDEDEDPRNWELFP